MNEYAFLTLNITKQATIKVKVRRKHLIYVPMWVWLDKSGLAMALERKQKTPQLSSDSKFKCCWILIGAQK